MVGHNKRAQGAIRTTDGRTEYDWNGELARLIQDHDPTGIRIFRRTYGGGYSQEIDRVYGEVDAWGADLSVELHFNSAPSPDAKGCLTLTSGTSKSLVLAECVHAKSLAVMGGEDDGINVRARRERGGRSLWQGKAPAIMTEPYFGSNADECRVADRHMDELAEAIYRGAREALGIIEAANPKPMKPATPERKPNEESYSDGGRSWYRSLWQSARRHWRGSRQRL